MTRIGLATLSALALLTACGGERPPEEVARSFVGAKAPSRCKDASQAFLERQSGRRGAAARDACARAAERLPPPADVRVTSTDRRGDDAEVTLAAGGQEVVVRLRRMDDRWLVSGLGR